MRWRTHRTSIVKYFSIPVKCRVGGNGGVTIAERAALMVLLGSKAYDTLLLRKTVGLIFWTLAVVFEAVRSVC